MEYIPSDSQIHGHTLKGIFVFAFLCICCVLTAFSQTPLSTSDKKAKKLYEKAEKSFKNRDFTSAISLFSEAAKRDPKFHEAYLRVGSLYNMMGDLDSVYVNFSKYADLSPSPSLSVLNRLAFMSFDRGRYSESQDYIDQYLRAKPELRDDREINLLLESLLFAKEQVLTESTLLIEKLPETINRFDLQYLPAITIDNSTMIFTKRDFVNDDEDIVVSYYKDGAWTLAESISSRINTPLNEGACTISADGKTMIFTSCDRRDSFGSCDLYISRKFDGNWSGPKNLGKSINTHYWESQPSLSADGNTLYFSSNRPGGQGGRDIWLSIYRDARWQSPQNLGAEANSFKDETTPFIHPNNEALYYSSNGFVGMGGFDLMKSDFRDSIWSYPTNLKYPINTYRDEVALLIAADGRTAYFAQENQKNNTILDSDIVSFTLPEELRADKASYIVGRVVDIETKLPLMATIEVTDVQGSKLIYENQSDSLSGEYLMVLPSGKELAGYVKKKGYLFRDFEFNSQSSSILKPDTILIELSRVKVGESIVLHNIYFETDSYQIDARSDSEIASVVQLLNENPTIKVEISGHTDDVGDKGYNQLLSEKRAKTLYDELIKNEVEPSRLSFKGYADEKPIYPNTSDFNRQSNRRIEFRVTKDK